jgi:hypothetical protein
LPRQDLAVGRDLHIIDIDERPLGDWTGVELAASARNPESDVTPRMQSNQRVALTGELGLACIRQFVHFSPGDGIVQANARLLSAGAYRKELAVR